MATEIVVQLQRVGPTTTEASVRSHRTLVDRPEAKGGADRGPMGGELLLASLGGCFASTLYAAILGRGVEVDDVNITVTGTLEEHPSRYGAIAMRVSARTGDAEAFERMVAVAERGCIVANTLRGAVDLQVSTVVQGSDG